MKLLTKTLLVLFFILSFTTLLFLLPSCDSPTDNEKTKSPRDYTWTVDTVYNPENFQTLMSSIWGSSENDVYMCGHASGSPGKLWHFDGIEWTTINLWETIGESASLTAVHGSAWNNVWVVGYQIRGIDGSKIPYLINYNGLKWTKHEIDADFAPFGVFVNGKNDVWVCGSSGIVGHFNGSVWQLDTLENPQVNYNDFQINSITGSKEHIFIKATLSDSLQNSYRYIFELSMNKWEVLDYMEPNIYVYEFGTHKIYFSSFGELYSIGPFLYKYTSNNDWSLELTSHSTWLYSMYDLGRNNIIAVATGEVYHNNGKDWKEIEELRSMNNYIYHDIWMNDKSIFIVGFLGNRTIVIKGN